MIVPGSVAPRAARASSTACAGPSCRCGPSTPPAAPGCPAWPAPTPSAPSPSGPAGRPSYQGDPHRSPRHLGRRPPGDIVGPHRPPLGVGVDRRRRSRRAARCTSRTACAWPRVRWPSTPPRRGWTRRARRPAQPHPVARRHVTGYVKTHRRQIFPDAEHALVPGLRRRRAHPHVHPTAPTTTPATSASGTRVPAASPWGGIARLDFPAVAGLDGRRRPRPAVLAAHAARVTPASPTATRGHRST